jgi:glycosyltransferase involved in cell wall biosynthesis
MRVIATHADRLRRRGHQVVVVSTPQVIRLRRKVKSLALGRGVLRPEPSYFDDVDVEHRVLESVRPVTDADLPDADVVLATYYTTAPGVLRLSPSKGAKAIFIQGYEVEEGMSNPALDATWRMPMHKIVVSRWLADIAREKFGDPRASLVPNSVDVSQFWAVPRGKRAVPTIGLVYSTSPFKGLRTSLEALTIAARTMPSLRVVSFGAERPIFGLRLPPSAEFHYRPAQAELRNLYAQCDVWMCGSNAEGFHLPPLEAMACRCPVVSTRVGWPLDAIQDGVNGYLVDVRDAEALARRVLCVLTLPEARWKEMSDGAYRTATSYSWEEATDLFEDALTLAIERNKRCDRPLGATAPLSSTR